MSAGAILVTGADGFLGHHLVPALSGAGASLALLSRRAGPSCAGARALVADLTERGAIERVLGEVRPVTIVHLAGAHGLDGAVACAEVNVAATMRLLAGAAAFGVRRIVLVGSADEYGDQPGPLAESLPTRPLSIYAISKAAATALALELHATTGCPVVVVRPFSVYGPGQPPHMFVAQAVAAARAGRPFDMSEGRQRRDLVHVDDVVAGLVRAANVPGIEGRVFNLATGVATALVDVARTIWRLTGATGELRVGALPTAPAARADIWADVTAARTGLGWTAGRSLEEGLRALAGAEGRAS